MKWMSYNNSNSVQSRKTTNFDQNHVFSFDSWNQHTCLYVDVLLSEDVYKIKILLTTDFWRAEY